MSGSDHFENRSPRYFATITHQRIGEVVGYQRGLLADFHLIKVAKTFQKTLTRSPWPSSFCSWLLQPIFIAIGVPIIAPDLNGLCSLTSNFDYSNLISSNYMKKMMTDHFDRHCRAVDVITFITAITRPSQQLHSNYLWSALGFRAWGDCRWPGNLHLTYLGANSTTASDDREQTATHLRMLSLCYLLRRKPYSSAALAKEVNFLSRILSWIPMHLY